MKTSDREFTGFVSESGRLTLDFAAAFRAYVKRFRGEEVTLTLTKKREKRSDRQNRGFHAMIAPWARDEGHRIDDLKRDLLKEIFGERESVSLVTGEVTMVLNEPHTSTLTVQQFSELIERTMEIAARMGYVLIAPDEWTQQQRSRDKKARAA